jgi:lipooligosaccharide transport system permease protein
MSWVTGTRAAPWAGAVPVIERSFLVYRRLWMVVLSGFFEPIFYLGFLGIGLGGLVPDQVFDGRTVDYLSFLAPALLAVSAMNGAVYDATLNFFWKLRYSGVYEGMLATSLGPGDVMVGETAWALLRGAFYAGVFLATAAAFGVVHTAWALLAVPAALLIGLAFATAAMAATTFVHTWQGTEYFQLVLVPMFLLSTTFYPASVIPAPVRPLIEVIPLYHGVALIRGLMLSGPSPDLLGHVAYLCGLAAAGMAVCRYRFDKITTT